MLIACIVVICLLIVFVAVTFFITHKNYKFEIEGGVLRVQNIGSHLKIYFNDKLIQDVFSPPLLNGASIDFNLGEKAFKLNCKCNYWGNKMQVEVLEDENVIASNGIKLKESKIKNPELNHEQEINNQKED